MKKILLSVFLCLGLLTIAVQLPAQAPQKKPGADGGLGKAPSPLNEAQKVTYQGKILFNKTMGGYFLKSESPSQEFIIVNQNPKVLDQFYKTGKNVTVIGHLTKGAEHLFIESIDGKKYRRAKVPAAK